MSTLQIKNENASNSMEFYSFSKRQIHSSGLDFEFNNNLSSENNFIPSVKKFKSNHNKSLSNEIYHGFSEINPKSQEAENSNELICVVCGSQANGYNFDAITCESCKAFFRRNAFRSVVRTII